MFNSPIESFLIVPVLVFQILNTITIQDIYIMAKNLIIYDGLGIKYIKVNDLQFIIQFFSLDTIIKNNITPVITYK